MTLAKSDARGGHSEGELTFRSYRREVRRVGPITYVHGHYDGLATCPVVHGHDQLLLPLGGRVFLSVAAGDGTMLGPEGGAWIPAGTPHAASSLDGILRFLAINLPVGWLGTLATAVQLAPPSGGLVTVREAGLWLQGQLLANALVSPPGGERFLNAGLEQVALLILSGVAEQTRPRPEDGVLRAVDHIIRHYMTDLKVEQLARDVALSPRHFERRFKQVMGSAPRRFLIGVRLAAARDLLATTHLSVEAIAVRVGFHDPAHLARTFRAEVGQTPAAYRRARLTI